MDELPLSQRTASQHLKELKEAGLIKGDIEGVKVCYCIDNFPGKAVRLYRNFQDPSKSTGDKRSIEKGFDAVRDEIKQFCRNFVEQNIA